MNRIVKATLSAIGLTLALPACAQTAPAAVTDADPALWVVKDADTTVYLFGTVHVLKPGLSWFDEGVKAAFDGSDTLVSELGDLDAAAAQQLFAARGINPAGPTLSDKLPSDKRALVTKALTDAGLPAQVYERMDPWLATVILTQLLFQKLGFSGENGAEAVLSAAAKAGGKQVAGLETLEQQVGFFDGLSQQAQIDMLVAGAEESAEIRAFVDQMVGHWSSGDAAGLARFMNENLKDSPELAKVLLTDRNKRWAEWISRRMEKPGTVFVAVGAGHLAGTGAVQEQLKAYKLNATRVKY